MNVIAYICNTKLKGLETSEKSFNTEESASLTEENGIVNVPLLPASVSVSDLYIRYYLHGLSSSITKICRSTGTLILTLIYDLVFGETNKVNIEYNNPDICDWETTEIRTTFGNFSLDTVPTTGDGEIPEKFEDVLGGHGNYEQTNNTIVPGEEVSLRWKFKDQEYAQPVLSSYSHSCCLTGGRVIAVNGSYGNYDISYDLYIEGDIYTNVLSNDFHQYHVGDWAFVLKTESECRDVKISECCSGKPFDEYYNEGYNYIIVPIRINNIGG